MVFLQWITFQIISAVVMSNDAPVVLTPLGKIQGFTMTSRSGKTFYGFKGLPYAKPPVGNLRFQSPEPPEPWSGVLIADNDCPICLQVSIFDPRPMPHGQEDCLYLSVFTRNLSGKAPVLFHIHGGAYAAGNTRIFGPHYLMDEDIVLVKVNFRVGILGFLSFENTEMPGNQGMKDQVMALHWVQQNIASFGGDPNSVTLIGESSGGASVYNHIISPMSKGLFHKAISISGTTYTPWGVSPPGFPKRRTQKLLNLLGCPQSTKEAINCLLGKDATEIVSKFTNFMVWQIDPCVNFGPVFEPPGPTAFLVGPVSKWEHNPVPLMVGFSSAEGLLRSSYLLLYNTDFKEYSKNFNMLAPISLMYYTTASEPDELTPKIRKFYLPNEEVSMNDWVNLTTMYTDSWFGVGILDGANYHKGDVFLYYFDYVLQGNSIFPLDQKLRFGAFHCSDMSLIWNLSIPMVANIANDYELSLSKQIINFFTTFMRNGSPDSEKNNIKWPKWTANNNNYIHITNEGFAVKKGLIEERYKFWKTLKYRDNFD